MVAILPTDGSQQHSPNSGTSDEPKNRLIRVLMRRLGSSKTFGENMIFMLNRASGLHSYFVPRHPLIVSLQNILQKICACSFFSSKFFMSFSRRMGRQSTFTRTICVCWLMSSFESWWIWMKRVIRYARLIHTSRVGVYNIILAEAHVLASSSSSLDENTTSGHSIQTLTDSGLP